MDDTLYKAFLTELEALEKFRMGYTALYPAAPLGREDQDVRRLTEALALFTARTRLAGQRAVSRATLRLFQQHFPYALCPMPAMALVRAEPDARFVDVTSLPRGSQVFLSPPRAGSGPGPLAFRTLAPLQLLPLELADVNIHKRGTEGFRLLLSFKSNHERNDTPGTLRLHINHLNEFLSSLEVHYHLKKSLRAASVFFTDRVAEDAAGQRCAVRFDAPPPPPAELEAFEHPLQRARAFFHFPQQALCMEVAVPPPPRNWRHITVCLDLGPHWPVELLLTPETFVLHAVPMVNLQRGLSNPIEHDGTRERHGLHHPDATGGYRVHSVLGAYRVDGDGMVPLRPGVIAGGPDTHEHEHEGQGEARRTWLSLNLPGAFMKPVRVAIDACWYQPLPLRFDASGYRVGLPDRFLEGVRWSTVGAVVPGVDNPLECAQEGLLQLLSIRNQRFLGLEDLRFLLEALGVGAERYFHAVVDGICSVEVRSKPFARSATGFKYIYRITFSELSSLLLPTIDLFSARLRELLRDWSTEDVVELEVSLPHLETELRYPPPEVAS